MSLRSRQGQGMTEAVMAAIIIVPIVLLLIDVMVFVIGNSMNESACKNAARAAANQPDLQSATLAAMKAVNVRNSPLLKDVMVSGVQYVGGEKVSVQTKATLTLPVPFPGWSSLILNAGVVEPVVGSQPLP